jgi:hypothetical protein
MSYRFNTSVITVILLAGCSCSRSLQGEPDAGTDAPDIEMESDPDSEEAEALESVPTCWRAASLPLLFAAKQAHGRNEEHGWEGDKGSVVHVLAHILVHHS